MSYVCTLSSMLDWFRVDHRGTPVGRLARLGSGVREGRGERAPSLMTAMYKDGIATVHRDSPGGLRATSASQERGEPMGYAAADTRQL